MTLTEIKDKLKLSASELKEIKQAISTEIYTSDYIIDRLLNLVGVHVNISNDLATYLMLNNDQHTEKEVNQWPFFN